MNLKKAIITNEHRQEAAALKAIWDNTDRSPQAEFGLHHGIGNQSAISQFLNGRIPLSIEAAVKFAQGLDCRVSDFSPRLATLINEMLDSASAQIETLPHESDNTPSLAESQLIDVRNTRVKNLKMLVENAGSIASFARQYDDIDPTFVSQLLNGHRQFGERAARNMENKIGLRSGFLDSNSTEKETKETLQERINLAYIQESERRQNEGEKRLTKTELWRTAGVSSGAATQWFTGPGGMALETCMKVAPVLNVDPFWLFDGSKPMSGGIENSDSTSTEYSNRLIWALERAGIDVRELSDALNTSYQAVKKVIDGKSFAFNAANNAKAARLLGVSSDWLALGDGAFERDVANIDATKDQIIIEVEDDSMSPDFTKGDHIIIDKNLKPTTGDYVLAQVGNAAPVLRRYRDVSDGIFDLIATDPFFSITGNVESQAQIVGVLVEHRRHFKQRA